MSLRSNDRSIAGFTMTGHALVHWFETSIPIFLEIWVGEFEVTLLVLGLVLAPSYGLFGFGALPAGALADRYGPRPLVLGCLAGMSLGFVGLALAPNVYGIAAALVVWGLAASVYHPAGLSLISTGVEDRGTVFAYHGIAGNVGIALGPFVAATLLVFLPWEYVASLLALPGLVAVAYGLSADFDATGAVDVDAADRRARAASPSDLFATSRTLFASAFAVVFAIVTVEGLFYRGTLTYLPEILAGLPALSGVAVGPDLTGIEPSRYVYVGFLVVGIAGQYVGGKLTGRVTPARGLASIFAVLAVLALAFVPVTGMGLGALLVLCGLLGFFLFAIQPFYQDAVAVYTPADVRGLSYGYTYLGEFGLGATSVAIGGYLLDVFPLTVFFAVLAAFALVGATLAAGLLVGLDRLVAGAGVDAAPDD